MHYSYLTWEFSSKKFDTENFKNIRENCKSYGVGLVTFTKDDAQSFKIHSKAERADPDPALVDDFIESRFDPQQTKLLLEFPFKDYRGQVCG